MKIAAIIPLIFLNGYLTAQSIELSVLNKNSEGMPYAFILVNGKPITATDSSGKAFIPKSKLKENDTISVSYLGAQPNWTIYNDSIKINEKYCFYLDESGYTLNEVVVTYRDIEKLFRKSIKVYPTLNYNCKMSAHFDFKFNLNPNKSIYPDFETSERSISGTLEAFNDFGFKPRENIWFDPPFKFITENDTNQVSPFMSRTAHLALRDVNFTIEVWQNRHIKVKPIYSFLGEKDSLNVFRLSYPTKSLSQNFYSQIVLYIDKKTKLLKHVELNAYNDEPVSRTLDNNQYMFKYLIKLSYDCELYVQKKPKKPTIYLPSKIDYTLQMIDLLTTNLKITDPKIKP